MTQRPDYIRVGGNVLMHAPLELKQAEMYGFFVRGDRAALQRTVDETLNAPAAGKMVFEVLSPYVMLTFTHVGHANSAWPSDRAKGWCTEVDIITWVMVGAKKTPEQQGFDHIYNYPCHIWVDNCLALINGRELYGYPKYQCTYTMPQPGEPALSFTLAAEGFQPFGVDTAMALHPLLEVTCQGNPQPSPLQSLEHLITQGLQLLAADADALDLDAAGWAQVAQMLLSPQVDQIFLKQFPDGTGTKAVYQAVVAAPAKVKQVRSVNLLGASYVCKLHPFASFPLDKTLGLPLGEQPAILPFHVSFDFEVGPGVELVNNSQVVPKKVAILGGGVAAMTAAFYLTDRPGWQDRFDITVYQMGWRLGGKGASGRNAALGQRIEEHGLHIWFGFYENAFATIQKAYGLLDRPPGAPLATWQEAFKEQHFVALTEWVRGQWETWPIDTPPRPGVPGHGSETLTLWGMVVTLFEWLKMWLDQLQAELGRLQAPCTVPAAPTDWMHRLAARIEGELHHVTGDLRQAATALHGVVQGLSHDVAAHAAGEHVLMKDTLIGLRASLHDCALSRLDLSDELRRAFICLDLGWTMLIGMAEDGVFENGFDVINDIDLRAWFAKHGASPVALDSAPLRGFYDLVFGYVDGDFDRPNVEAGTMLRCILLIGCAYQGAIMWKMQAGMGDTVFTPFYQVLKDRGVKFNFFHKVEEMRPAADGSPVVERIRLTQQVALKDGTRDYHPLVDVKGLACWPSQPDLAQIVPAQAALLQANNINLESNWSNWPEVYQAAFGEPLPSVMLERGRDFDQVVYGISFAAMPDLCPELVARSPALASTCGALKAVATQAYQVWLTKDIRELGWTEFGRGGQEPVLSGFTEPYDTWAPMDQLLVREDWPAAFTPKNVSYFCSAMPVAAYPPSSDHAFPQRMAAEAKRGAVAQLGSQMQPLWPAVATPTSFDWSCLVDPCGGQGPQRFDSQYWRANVDPSERYVLSVVNSTAYRLATDGSGFGNLFLTGDWIRTGLNAGCVEAAVMAGMQTSRAMSGWPQVIKGEQVR